MSNSRNIADSAPVINFIDGVTSNVQTQLDAKATYPSQSGNNEKFLTTNGSAVSWADLPASGGVFTATASGAIASGDKIVVNTDGTISAVTGSAVQNSVTTTNYMTGNGSLDNAVGYDTTNDRVIVAYSRDGVGVKARAGTVATDGTVSWGTEVTVESGNSSEVVIAFDEAQSKFVIAFRDSSSYGKARPAIVDPSNNSITLGTAVVFNSITHGTDGIQMTYDSDQNHIAVMSNNTSQQRGELRSFQLSGSGVNTAINVSAVNTGIYANINYINIAYDRDTSQIVIFYSNVGASGQARAKAGSFSGTGANGYYNFTQGETTLDSSSTSQQALCYDPISKQVVAFWINGSNQSQARCIKAASTNVISLGTQLSINDYMLQPKAVYNSFKQYIVLVFRDYTGGISSFGALRTFSVTGTTITATPTYIFQSSTWGQVNNIGYDPDNNYTLAGNYNPVSGNGDLAALKVAFTDTNLSNTRWIGVSNAAYANGVSAEIKTRGSVITNSTFKDIDTILGAAATADTAASATAAISYDSNSDRYLAVYRHGSTNYGTCVVIQVDSSNNLTFGTPTTFASFIVKPNLDVAFDSNVNKFVIAYANNTPQSLARIAIINPSNNSVTFGTEASVTTETSIEHAISFDSNVNKFLICYGRYSPAGGNAKVATINSSANTLSFGAEATFDSAARARYSRSAFDSNINKIIISFIPHSTANGSAIVATINASANTVSFGSASIFASDQSVNSSRFPQITYDSTSTKSVISYEDTSGTNNARVATINSSTSAVTYGTEASIDSTANAASYQNIVAISGSKVLICYEKGSNGNYKIATISGTSLLVGDEVQFVSGSAYYFAPFYNPTNDQVVFNYAIGSTTGGVATSFSRNLSAGTSYLINFDGTITTTASDFTVSMGTALNSTTVFTKGV